MRSAFTISRPEDAAARLDAAAAALRALPLTLEPAHLPRVHARLAVGDFEAVRALLTAAPSAALPLTAALYHDWSGDLTTVLGIFDAVRESIELVAALEPPHRAATWTALQRLANDAGDPQLAASLLRRARSEPDLPETAQTRDPAATVLHLISQLLGIEPDAHRGRIRLRPDLVGKDEVHAAAIRFSDGAVSLQATRTGPGIEVKVEQVAGAVPFTALLEPVVPAATMAWIDGRAANDLDIRPHGSGVIVPSQLVLDDVRTLLIEIR